MALLKVFALEEKINRKLINYKKCLFKGIYSFPWGMIEMTIFSDWKKKKKKKEKARQEKAS